MTSHELAKQLLAGPDCTIVIPNEDEWGVAYQEVKAVTVGVHGNFRYGPQADPTPEEMVPRVFLLTESEEVMADKCEEF